MSQYEPEIHDITEMLSSILGEPVTSKTPVAFVGDMHGDFIRLRKVIARYAKKGVKIISILGDIGIWDPADGDKFGYFISEIATQHNVVVLAVDGNHENHPFIQSLPMINGLHVHPIRERLADTHRFFIAPRGFIHIIDGVSILSLGGATSLDFSFRTPGFDWFVEEAITSEDCDQAIASIKGLGRPVDIMWTHNIPSDAANPRVKSLDYEVPYHILAQDSIDRRLIREVASAAQPRYIFSGHWHVRATIPCYEYTVEVMSYNKDHLYSQVYMTTLEDVRHA